MRRGVLRSSLQEDGMMSKERLVREGSEEQGKEDGDLEVEDR